MTPNGLELVEWAGESGPSVEELWLSAVAVFAWMMMGSSSTFSVKSILCFMQEVISEFSSAFMHNGELPSSDIMMLGQGHWKIQHSVSSTIIYTQLMMGMISHFGFT